MQASRLVAALCLALPLVAFAQTPRDPAATPGVDKRQVNQEARIQQGVKSGELTQKEAARLEKGQERVQQMENKAKADGKVTAKERERLQHTQDVQSKKIYREKHDKQKDLNHNGKNDRREQVPAK